MRAILDTNVIVAGLLTPVGAPGTLLELHAAGAFELVISPHLLEELREVLARPHLADRLVVTVDEITTMLATGAEVHEDRPAHHPTLPTDPDDGSLIDLAMNADALLVSGDRALLRIAATAPVLSPAAFLDLLRTLDSPLRDRLPNQIDPADALRHLHAARRATVRASSAELVLQSSPED